jgi:hypothetical protein
MERSAALAAAVLLASCAGLHPRRSEGELRDPLRRRLGPHFLAAGELRPREFGFPSSARYDTRASGTLRVSVRFEGSGRSAVGDVELPLRPDWIWGVSLHVTARDPREGCMGCMGVRSFPLSGAPAGEQLHLVWGGNSISAPAVY